MSKQTKSQFHRALLACSLFAVALASPTYAVTPTQSTQKVYPADGRAADEAFYSVSMSGNVAVLGAYLADPRGTDSGAAYVYRFNGSSWVQEQKLVASDGTAGDRFGSSVAIDSTTVIVGAPFDDDRGTDSGSFYVFRYNGTSWIQSQKLTATPGVANEYFGNSISVSGNNVVVGAYGNSEVAGYAGAAYAFRNNGTTWSQVQKFLPPTANTADGYGKSVSVFGDFAVIGCFQDDTRGVNAGAAYTFRWTGSTWAPQTKLMASDGAAYQIFGNAVAMGAGVALVGAPKDDDRGNMSGSAYIFRYNTSTQQWAQEAKLLDPNGGSGDQFGTSVSISGTTALVGSPWWEDRTQEFPQQDQGAAYVYANTSGTTWVAQSRLLAQDGYYFDMMSSSVAISGDLVMAGANKEDAIAMDSGAGYYFRVSSEPPPQCTSNSQCNDNNQCTVDTCESGSCRNVNAATGTACNDGLYCNGADSCSAGACSVHAGNPCTAGAVCANVCNESADNCFAPANTACTADTNACTNDVCNGSGACTHPLKPAGSACGSSTTGLCDNADTCSATGVCQSNSLPNGSACLDDGNECTNDVCSAGVCTHPNKTNGTACTADASSCTNDVCTAGVCTHPLKPAGSACGSSSSGLCDNPDTCSATGVCMANNLPNGSACADDGNECTNDTCSSGICAHPAKANGTACTPDTSSCTNDVCTSGVCTHPNKAAGSACGSASSGLCDNPDTCNSSGVCMANNLPNGSACSDDGNQCTNDTCSSGVCVHPAKVNGTACDDGNMCTDADSCLSGVCRSGVAETCDDSDPCTTDTCSQSLGCQSVPISCPVGQMCNDGVCGLPIGFCGDGVCDADEDDCSCSTDCQAASCGNGLCEAYAGEDCRTCVEDCRGRLTGPLNKQFCCGDDAKGEGASCDSLICNSRGWTCTDAPLPCR